MIREARTLRRAYRMLRSDSQVETVMAVALAAVVLIPMVRELRE
jgi:hypothetical protein